MSDAELAEAVNRLASGLLARGIGARTAWAFRPQKPWIDAGSVRLRAGRGDPANVNPAYRTYKLSYVLRQSGVFLLFSPGVRMQ